MQNLKEIYRATYGGETIVTDLTHIGSDWQTKTEFIPNRVFSSHTSTQAICIGNGESRLDFDLTHIANHKGGLLAEDKLQSYGCNALYRDFAPDFLVAVGTDIGGDNDITDEIAASGYTNDHIVYTNTHGILEHPGKFYLIPGNVQADSGAVAAYLACFDGHKKVFLLGYDNYLSESTTNNVYKDTAAYPDSAHLFNGAYFELSLKTVMETYPTVEFIRVMPQAQYWCPPSWTARLNFRQIGFRDFVLEADLG
jgi:hypothetical protein